VPICCDSDRLSKDSKMRSDALSPRGGSEVVDAGSRCEDQVTKRRSLHGPRKVYVLREVDFNSASDVATEMKVRSNVFCA
jgi:hypothetical protein